MFSHVTVGVSDLSRAAVFYDALLAPLGFVERPVSPDGGPRSLCWHRPGAPVPRFYTLLPFDGEPSSYGNGGMVAFLAPSDAAVSRAYELAMASGGKDEGQPGPRPHYGTGYFGAYLRDPDGNKVHVVHRADLIGDDSRMYVHLAPDRTNAASVGELAHPPRLGGTDSVPARVSVRGQLIKALRYKAWANKITFDAVAALPHGEDRKVRATHWESIAYTLSHVMVVDDIFRQHLQGSTHRYTFRNLEDRLPVSRIRERQTELDRWYCDWAAGLDDDALVEEVSFEFVGGGAGRMSRADIIMHVVNHGTYHRGLVSDMMSQVPAAMPPNDLTVFLRDVWHDGARPSRS